MGKCEINELKLIRMKPELKFNPIIIPSQEPYIEEIEQKITDNKTRDPCRHKPWEIGCPAVLTFDWGRFEVSVCKRARWVKLLNQGKWKYKDWKITVRLKEMRNSKDYIVLYKLPVPLEKLEAFLRERLWVVRTQNLTPEPIEYISLRLDALTVYSQMFYDRQALDESHKVEDYATHYLT